MGALSRFFDWLLGLLQRAVANLATFTGMIVTACGSAVALVGGLFGRFTWLSEATEKVQEATGYVSDVLTFADHPTLLIVYNAVAVDRILQIGAALFSATVGVAVLMFVTVFVAFMALVPAVLVVKAIARAVKVASMGVLEP